MDQKNLVHKNFKKYKVAYSSSIIDHKDNLLIIPEASMYLDFSMKFKKLRNISAHNQPFSHLCQQV